MEVMPQGGLMVLSTFIGLFYGLAAYLVLDVINAPTPGAYALLSGASFALLMLFILRLYQRALLSRYTKLEKTLGNIALNADVVYLDDKAAKKKMRKRIGRIYVTGDGLTLVSFGDKPYLTEKLLAAAVACVTGDEENRVLISLTDGRAFTLVTALSGDVLKAAEKIGLATRRVHQIAPLDGQADG